LQVELLIFVIALCIVAFLATRFGYDSRASAWSKEAELGAHGVTWESDGGLPLDLDSPEGCDLQGTDFSEPRRQEFDECARELVGSVRT
jgi:hypothetical protein